MKVSVENGDGCRRTVNVNVPIEDVRDDYDMIVKTLVKGAKISGFRPGRAPRELVEKRYSKAIMQETRDRLVPKFYNKAIEQEELNPVAVVDVTNVEFSPESGLQFNVELDIQPEFK
jgi:trigger factor